MPLRYESKNPDLSANAPFANNELKGNRNHRLEDYSPEKTFAVHLSFIPRGVSWESFNQDHRS